MLLWERLENSLNYRLIACGPDGSGWTLDTERLEPTAFGGKVYVGTRRIL
ncbi:hypothetical protein Gbro_4033 [Gordonia bronchialis DSM 43247]|uniref:Uncharacterized protein n=1 Tax=Gordonia bronchialis (strain ATCC 25592 / DSM 43247 / BCRC 13721 / JCM 3198 / KCTC 3076 / NBRC 16047 / NCTC 10667) TaxID=526226 RepID=D0L4H5_GORB4|nr:MULTISPECIES: hypothetical protein [Gordonia]ACY23200.1 hypothetical protein Gbro_4033 [Gordonia bronchialis DSM 43247]MCC3325985.1 hypothetical protein [Gordonia bronchialis]MCH5643793.1 hypothetical protein [Gordonia sp. ABSL49_1]QGS23399.1 hypothetical protein FOB84_03635 [Gordonia bronchialis]STQ66167.1 Uncharacterised protein [Gordonia bronchialis]